MVGTRDTGTGGEGAPENLSGAPVEPAPPRVSTGVGGAVARGIGAMVAVAVALGLLFGAGVMVLTKAAGLGEGSDDTSASSPRATLFLTDPTTPVAPRPKASGTKPPTTPKVPTITIRASAATAGPMEVVTIDGTYASNIGVVLQVQRLSGEEWADFPVTDEVKPDGTYSVTVQTGVSGPNQFRLYDRDNDRASEPVTLTIS